MTTVLFYLVVAALIGLVVFFLAVLVFGRGEQMAPLDPRTSPAELPDDDIAAEDVRKIRFALALRGYRMSDVDWTLERLGEQLDRLRRENAILRGDEPLDENAVAVAPSDDEPIKASEPDLRGREPVSVGAPTVVGNANGSMPGEVRSATPAADPARLDGLQRVPDAVPAVERDDEQ